MKARLETAAEDYAIIKERCESQVVRWEWATAEMNNLRLLRNERGRYPRGRWVKNQPKKTADRVKYGFDDQDRAVVIRKGIALSDTAHHQVFAIYGRGFAESVEFDSMFTNPSMEKNRSEFVRVVRQTSLDGVPIDCTWYAAHQRGFETYSHRSGHLVSIDSTWSNRPHEKDDVLSATYDVSHDNDGSLALLTVTYRPVGRHSGGTFTCFKKKLSK